MTVVDLRNHAEENEPMIWMCDCGNCCFTIYVDGTTVCTDCNAPQSTDAHYQTVARWTRKHKED